MARDQTDVRLVETADRSGAGMDRVLSRRWPRWLVPAGAAAVLALTAVAILALRPGLEPQAGVDETRITIAAAERGTFEDFIPVRGRVAPERAVFLDAVEGGRVEAVHVVDGADVAAGDAIVTLSNSQLQLDVISREADVAEQLNNLRTLELDLERNRLEHARNLVEIDYQITRLERLVGRREELALRDAISQADLEAARDELDYYRRRREVTVEASETDARLTEAQMEQLRDSSVRLEANLELARRNLDALVVRAPTAGVLTAFSAEVGQSLPRGQRLGQIDSPSSFKLVASVDEFYIDRVEPGLTASAEIAGRSYALRIGRIDPQVTSGQFEAELLFADEQPAGLRRGQSVQLRLHLGAPEPALMLPAGAFLQETGGRWAFVVEPDGATAMRRTIVTGRRNTRFVEIVDGIAPGERVIVSSYARFADAERLTID